MASGIFLVGTDTGVGKTVVSAGLTHLLRKEGLKASYFKPVLSGAISLNDVIIPGDTRFVKEFAGLKEEEHQLTPYSFQTPVSPHLAAEIAGVVIDKDVIKRSFEALSKEYDYLVVEGAGGLCVPLMAPTYMQYDLIKDLGLDVLVVCRAGLGTINHTVLTVRYAETVGLKVKGIVVNGYTGQERFEEDNIEIIRMLTNLPVVGVLPKIKDLDVDDLKFGNLTDVIAESLNIKAFLGESV